MKHLSLLLILALALFAFPGKAAEESKPAPEIEKLHKLAGKWKIEETNFESPFGPAGKSTYEAENALIHNGHYMEEKGKGESFGKPVTYTTLTYWDGNAKTYRGLYYDSNGFVFPAEATFDGQTMAFTGKVEGEGMKLNLKGSTTFASDFKSFKYEWNYSEDGGKTWKKMFTGTGTRVGK